jgi:NAD(P)-dependent dehydrogenase (short-subunit alcohol dehydrogenase family)
MPGIKNTRSSVVVTGASSGLGLAASAKLAAERHVILACRSVERGEAAAVAIRERAPSASVEVLELDLGCLASVRSAASTLINDRPPLHALVCNAGIQVVNGVRRSQDGYELTFATNHLGHFLLTELLLDHIAEPGRIVMVSSGTHYGPPRSLGFPGPRWEKPDRLADPSHQDGSARAGRIRYSTSKLANLYTTYDLAHRLADREITVNAVDPGLMPETRLDRDWPARLRRLYGRLTPLLIRAVPGARSVDDAAAAVAWLVTAPELAGVTGAYFAGRRRTASSKESYDRGRAVELRAVSEELVGA